MPRLGYYGQQWPFPQGAAAGPYPMFAGPLRGLPHAAQPQCGVVMVGRRMIHLSPQRRPLPCVCHTQAVKMRARRRRLGAMGDAGLPAGTQLVYSATWSTGVLLQDYSTVVANITNNLKSQGIVIDSSSGVPWYKSGYGVTLNIHVTTDFNSPQDVKSIIDHWIYANSSGAMPQSSITTAALAQQIPSTPAGTAVGTNNTAAATDMANYQAAIAAGDTVGANMWQAQYQADMGITPSSNPLSWLTNNWQLAAGLGLAAVVIWKVA